MAKKKAPSRAAAQKARATLTAARKGGVSAKEKRSAEAAKRTIQSYRKSKGRAPKTGKALYKTVATPGRAGVRSGTVPATRSGEDMLQEADHEAGWAQELGGLQSDYTEQAGNVDYQAGKVDPATGLRSGGQLGREERQRLNSTNDSAISRGIFRSSVTHNALVDVSADINLRRAQLESQLSAANLRIQNRTAQIANDRRNLGAALDRGDVETAAEQNGNSPWAVEPQAPGTKRVRIGNAAARTAKPKKTASPKPRQGIGTPANAKFIPKPPKQPRRDSFKPKKPRRR